MNITETKPGYKKTKLGWIPEEWEVKRLGKLGKLLNGLTYSPSDIDDNGTLVLRSSNIHNRRLVFEDNVYVKVHIDKYNPVLKGDIIICVRNGSKSLIGKNAQIDKEAEGVAFGAFMAVYRSNYNDFLFQIFDTKYYKREVHRNLGATINSINGSNFRKFLIPLPPLPEQKKIASILSTWDQAIEKTQALIEQLKLRKKGLMQQLLSGKKRLTGFSGEWKTEKLGINAQNRNIKNNNKYSGENLFAVTKKYGIVPMREQVKGNNFTRCKIVQPKWFAYNPMRINIGSISLHNGDEEVMVSGDYVVFECLKDKLLPEYLDYIRLGNLWENFMSIAGNGSVRVRIYFKDLADFKFKVPPINEQKAIITLLKTVDREIAHYQNYLSTLQTQKKGLMQQLLTGQKRVQI